MNKKFKYVLISKYKILQFHSWWNIFQTMLKRSADQRLRLNASLQLNVEKTAKTGHQTSRHRLKAKWSSRCWRNLFETNTRKGEKIISCISLQKLHATTLYKFAYKIFFLCLFLCIILKLLLPTQIKAKNVCHSERGV